MNNSPVIVANGYDRIDGRNAYHSAIKKITLASPVLAENKSMKIAAQMWGKNNENLDELLMELPIHQIFDLIIMLTKTMLYFKEAYRMPLLYNPEKPSIERIGVQGGVFPIEVCTENVQINKDIKDFEQSLSDLGELTGDRLRTLTRIIKELECY